MAVDAYIPGFSIVTITALVDAINPCAIGVLILLMSVLVSKKMSRKRILLLGTSYISAVFTVYLVAGFGLLAFLTVIPLLVTEYISIGVSILVIFAGVIEIKDFFWYGQGLTLSIPNRVSKKLPKLSKNTTFFGIILLGAFVSAVELPCTGAPYLAIITFLSQNFDFTAVLLLIWYNILFVSPLIVVLLLILLGVKVNKIKKWKERNRAYMRLAIGVILILLGWLLILISNGTINLT